MFPCFLSSLAFHPSLTDLVTRYDFFYYRFFFRFNSLISHCFSVRLSLFKTFLYFSFFLSEIFPIVPLCDSSLSCLPFSLSFFFILPHPFSFSKFYPIFSFPVLLFYFSVVLSFIYLFALIFLNTSSFCSSVLFVFLRSSPSHFSSSHSLSLFSVL